MFSDKIIPVLGKGRTLKDNTTIYQQVNFTFNDGDVTESIEGTIYDSRRIIDEWIGDDEIY